MNEMLAQPTSASAASSTGKVGASAASMITAPNAPEAKHERAQPGAAYGGHKQAANHRAGAHRGGHEAIAGRAHVQPLAGHDRQVTWNS